MKTYIVSLALALCSLGLFAQGESDPLDIEIGDVFEIGKVTGDSYKHIIFPKDNFIIKRGGIATYKNIAGSLVSVERTKTNSDGSALVTIKRVNGNRFFGSHSYVKVQIDDAIQSGELIAR